MKTKTKRIKLLSKTDQKINVPTGGRWWRRFDNKIYLETTFSIDKKGKVRAIQKLLNIHGIKNSKIEITLSGYCLNPDNLRRIANILEKEEKYLKNLGALANL